MSKIVYLVPDVLGALDSSNWSIGGGAASKVAAIYPGLPPASNSDFLQVNSPNQNKISFTVKNKPNDILSVVSVRPELWASNQDNSDPTAIMKLAAAYGTTVGTESDVTGIAAKVTKTADPVGRPGGGAWTPADIAEPSLAVVMWASTFGVDSPLFLWRIYELWIRLEYEPIPAQDGPARDAASRSQWDRTFEAPATEMTFLNPADAFRFGMLDLVGISNREGPHAQGQGWRSRPWERALHRPVERRLNLNTGETTVVFQRARLCLLRFTGQAASPHASADGVAFFAAGSTIEFSRDSVAWVADPGSGGTSLVRVEPDQPKFGLVQDAGGDFESGLISENALSNALPYSSFRDGLTGWTTVDGSGAVTAATSPRLFADPADTANVLKIVAGSPHSARSTATSTATASLDVDEIFVVQAWHRTAAGATVGPGIVIQRLFDFEYYTVATQTWGATRVVNPTPASDDWIETIIEDIDVGSNASAVRVEIAVEAGEPSASEYYVGHVQVTRQALGLGTPSTPIITDAEAVTGAADALAFTNDSGGRCFNEPRGALSLFVIPLQDQTTSVVLALVHDSSNRFDLRWHEPSAAWQASWEGGGTTYTATFAGSVSRGVPVRVGVRWTGDDDELDLGGRTLDIFIDGVKGASVTITDMTEAATSNLTMGNVAFRDLHLYAYVPTDEEMARLPRS
jgi:hypothetical protein